MSLKLTLAGVCCIHRLIDRTVGATPSTGSKIRQPPAAGGTANTTLYPKRKRLINIIN